MINKKDDAMKMFISIYAIPGYLKSVKQYHVKERGRGEVYSK